MIIVIIRLRNNAVNVITELTTSPFRLSALRSSRKVLPFYADGERLMAHRLKGTALCNVIVIIIDVVVVAVAFCFQTTYFNNLIAGIHIRFPLDAARRGADKSSLEVSRVRVDDAEMTANDLARARRRAVASG